MTIWKLVAATALAVCVSSAADLTCGARGPAENMLVTAAWLSQHQADSNLVILAVGDQADYQAGHIPGSRFLDYMDTHYMKSPSGLTLELLPMPELARNFEKMGVSNGSRIVLYWTSVNRASFVTRVYWTLDSMGLAPETSILDGGWPLWKSAGGALSTDVQSPAAGKLNPCPRADTLADAAYVRAHLNYTGVQIVDARAPEYYSGEKHGNGKSDGHIPGATNLTFNTLLDVNGKFRSREALSAMFHDAGIKQSDRVVSYCHIGQQATMVYFAARYLGYDARLYDGSWEDWSAHGDYPIVKSTK